jgi:hypothetical protein
MNPSVELDCSGALRWLTWVECINQSQDVARVAAGVVDVGQDPAVILAAGVGARDEDRLDCSQPQPVRQQTAERQTLCYV